MIKYTEQLIIDGCSCFFEGARDCGLEKAEYLSGTYEETWDCDFCGCTFKVPTELETIGDRIDCDTIERDWNHGETIILANHQYELILNRSK